MDKEAGDQIPSLGVLEGYEQMAAAWGPGTKTRRISYLAERGLIRTFPIGRRRATTVENLRADRDALSRGGRRVGG